MSPTPRALALPVPQPPLDRRIYPRHAVPHSAEALFTLPDGIVICGQVTDLSEGGMSLQATQRLPDLLAIGATSSLVLDYGALQISGSATVCSIAQVKDGFRLGLKLTALTGDELFLLRRILEYIRRHEEFVRTYKAG